MEKKGIAIAGNLICDILHRVDTYPRIGRLTKVRSIEQNVGGACNLILDLAKIDSSLPLLISGIVGDDDPGRYVLEVLRRYPNIDTQNVTVEGDTSRTFVMDAADSGQRTFFYYPGVGDIYDASYIDWAHLQADIFHLEYLLLLAAMDEEDEACGTVAASVLKKARGYGMKTSIDAVSEEGSRAGRIIRAALPYTDYCTLNELEAEAATGISLTDDGRLLEENVWKALTALAVAGVSRWAVIHSRDCSYGLDIESGKRVQVQSLKLPEGFIKGSTGAGDAFCCGVLYAAWRDMGLEEALRLGVGCAVCSLSSLSGTDGMREYGQVMALYESLEK